MPPSGSQVLNSLGSWNGADTPNHPPRRGKRDIGSNSFPDDDTAGVPAAQETCQETAAVFMAVAGSNSSVVMLGNFFVCFFHTLYRDWLVAVF